MNQPVRHRVIGETSPVETRQSFVSSNPDGAVGRLLNCPDVVGKQSVSQSVLRDFRAVVHKLPHIRAEPNIAVISRVNA